MSPVKERSERQRQDIISFQYLGTGGCGYSIRDMLYQRRQHEYDLARQEANALAVSQTTLLCRQHESDVARQEEYADMDAFQQTVEVEMVGIRMPSWLTIQQELKIAQVKSYEPALRLLAELYDKVSLPASALINKDNTNTIIAVAMLAAAGLCDVSPSTVRLSPEGKDFVELLKGANNVAVLEA